MTSSSAGKRALFQSDRLADLFCKTLIHYRESGKFLLHAFVLMPDHFHALLTVDHSLSIERAVQFLKGGFSHAVSEELSLRSEIWQRGFSEIRILEAGRFRSAVEYTRESSKTWIVSYGERISLSIRQRQVPTGSNAAGAKAPFVIVRCGAAEAAP